MERLDTPRPENVGKKMNVTVVITVYNYRNFISYAIESLLAQTYKDFTAIIVDDGSTDCSEEVILPYTKKYSNFIYLRHSNQGQAVSLNTALKITDTPYITFLDADDRYKPDHLEKRINYFQNNPDIDIISSTVEIIGTPEDSYVVDATDSSKLIHINNCIVGGTLFGKTKIFRELGGFNDTYGYDFEFFNRAALKYKTAKLDIPTYIYYRNHPDSITAKLKKNYDPR